MHLALSHHKWLNAGKDVLTQPYGIDVNPVDGGIWYAKLMANKIGHIDPEGGARDRAAALDAAKN